MKKSYELLRAWINSFFFISGVLFIILVVLPGRTIITPYETQLCLLVAGVFSIAHVFISTDCISSRMPIKTRFLICIMPCGTVAGLFASATGLTHILGLTDGTHSQNAAIFGWLAGLFLCIAIALLVFFFIGYRLKKAGEVYNQALNKYKESM